MAYEMRERTFRWPDPDIYTPWIKERSGREFLQALADGTLPNPPMFELQGFRVAQVGDGELTVESDAAEYLYNPAVVIHGGYAATLLDTVTALALRSRLAAGQRMTTIEIKCNFIRPLFKESGRLISTGKVIHQGRRTGIADGEVRNAEGKLIARGSATLAILDGNDAG